MKGKIEYGKTYIIGGVPRVVSSKDEYKKMISKEKEKTMSLLMAQLYQPGDVEIKIPKLITNVKPKSTSKNKLCTSNI